MENNLLSLSEDKTLKSFLAEQRLSATFNAKKFLDYSANNNAKSNWFRIKRNCSGDDLINNENKYNSGDYDNILIKDGTVLVMPNSEIVRDLGRQKAQPSVSFTSDFKPFIAKEMKRLLNDHSYVNKIKANGADFGTVNITDFTVYAWIRSLSQPGSESEGTWLNITPFVQIVQTNVTAQGGSFAITLSPVEAEYTEDGWRLKSVYGYNSGNVRDDVKSVSHISKFDSNTNTQTRNNFFFNTVMQENDLIYIRFEKLGIEDEKRIQFNSDANGLINPHFIPGNIYDMIGLVDSVTQSVSINSVDITVVGRDMIKLLIEDGSYFFPEQFAQNIFTDDSSLLAKRNRFELIAQELAYLSFIFRPIDTILKFIFNKYSNLGIVPNSVFNGYGDRAEKSKYELKSSIIKSNANREIADDLNDNFFANEDRQGVWRIVDFVFDPQSAQRVLADNSICQDSGSIINSIQKICQTPFVEFSGDTYGDRYYFKIIKPPFDKVGYTGMVFDDVISDGEPGDTVNRFSVEGGIDNVDKNVDNSIQGITVLPAAEYTEVIKRESIVSNLVVDIDESEVLSEPSFIYHNEAYSWYRLIPRGFEMDEGTLFKLAPVVALDEYALMWGNRTMSLEYNYCPSNFIIDAEVETELKYVEAQVFADLRFMIESNAYLPFTRRGTITIAGDRTIKRGMFIYYKPTNEIGYVDSVANTASIDGESISRSTTVNVSRMMKLPYIKGVVVDFPNGPQNISYFNIIDLELPNAASLNENEFLKNWKVNQDVFNFFVQRRQWAE